MLSGDHRIYLQYKPTTDSLAYLLEWQKSAIKENPQARPVQSDRLHLTVIHVGIIQDVYRELSAHLPQLDWITYTSALHEFITQSQSLLPKQVSVEPKGFAMFGHNSSVLAIALTPDTQLEQAHARSLEQLKLFFKTCGMEFPVPFMQGSPNFRYALTLRPHISLLKAARHRPPALQDVPNTLQLEAMPIHYT